MRARVRLLCLAAVLCGPLSLPAQSPVVLPRGVSPILDDTIYRLAVDSATHSRYASIILLDDEVATVQADGRYTITAHRIIQILRQEGVQGLQERSVGYDADHEHVSVDRIRMLRTDGTVLSETPARIQVSDVPADMVNPVYAHRKVLHLPLTGLTTGTLIDETVTREVWKPYRPGDFYLRFRFATRTMVRRARLVIDAPKDLRLHLLEHHLDFARRDTIIGSRTVYQWAMQQILFQPQEAFAPPPDSTNAAVGLDVAPVSSWGDAGRWYMSLGADRLRPDEALRDTVRRVVARASTLADSVLALHRWVTQDIRYVEIALGQGGFQPRLPSAVLATGFGDCKDKATLLINALGLIGVRAFPVLINVTNLPDSTLPTIHAFNHEIVAIERPTGYQYVDPTAQWSRLEILPWADGGKFALVLHPDGKTEEVTTPSGPTDANRSATTLTGELTPDGAFSGRFEMRGSGAVDAWMRAVVSATVDSAGRNALLLSYVAGTILDARLDSLALFDGRDFRATPIISFVIRDAHPTQRSGNVDILQQSDWSETFTNLDKAAAAGYRTQAIDAARVLPSEIAQSEIRITLPPGWQARLPPSASVSSDFGAFAAYYRQDGRTLTITHRFTGALGIYPKNRRADLVAWLLDCAKDHAPVIMIDHAAS